MNIRYAISIKDKFILVSFAEGEEFQTQQFQAEMASLIPDSRRFIALDFTSLPRLDVKLLTQIDPTIRSIRATKRKFALCCNNPTIQTVLEVTGMINADSTLFKSVEELEKHVQTYMASVVKTALPQQPASVPHPSPKAVTKPVSLKSPLLVAGGIGIAILVLLLLVLQIVTMKQINRLTKSESGLSLEVLRLHHQIDSVTATLTASETESQVYAELETVATDSESQQDASVATLAREYAQQSPRLRWACRDLWQAQKLFKEKNGNCAVQAGELGWKPPEMSMQVRLEPGEECLATIVQKTLHGMELSFSVNTINGTIRGVP
jgi:anti-anti-sigma regulatory factor